MVSCSSDWASCDTDPTKKNPSPFLHSRPLCTGALSFIIILVLILFISSLYLGKQGIQRREYCTEDLTLSLPA
jgi:hypothetical protein